MEKLCFYSVDIQAASQISFLLKSCISCLWVYECEYKLQIFETLSLCFNLKEVKLFEARI
jgi:hypothetical protein